jgi:co-chaperonin GroES (HSP10)
MPVNIDALTPQKHLIDLSAHSEGDFGLDDYKLSFVFDNILAVEYIDLADDGNSITRNGLYVPTNAQMRAWRKGKVVIAGPESKYAKVGDIVMFPNNLGATVSNIEIEGYGILKKGIFLNEDRLFGICAPKQNNK